MTIIKPAMKRIFLIGYMGCGKTTAGKRLSEKYNLNFIDLDYYIEQRYLKTIAQLFGENGENGFRKIEQDLLKEVAEIENVIISTGGGTACFFDNIELMNRKGETVYLKASAAELASYLSSPLAKNRPLLSGKTDDELLNFISETLEKREPFYSKAKHTINARDMSDELFDKLLLQG